MRHRSKLLIAVAALGAGSLVAPTLVPSIEAAADQYKLERVNSLDDSATGS